MESPSLSDEFGVLRKQLGKITDERLSRGKVFPLDGVLGLVVLGLMCGQRSLSAINRFGECHEQVLSQLGLRRSPSVQTLSRLLRMVSVSEVREALMEFVREVMELRGEGVGVVSMDGKTVRGVRENGEQLRLLHLFSREGSVALDQVEIAHHHEEPRAAERWIRMVSSRFEGLEVLSGDALYANTNLAEAIVAEGKDYVIKLKKPTRAPRGRAVRLLRAARARPAVDNQGTRQIGAAGCVGIIGAGWIQHIPGSFQCD